MDQPPDVIIGANGFIGSHLYHYLKNKGRNVIGTTHDASIQHASLAYLDLCNPDKSFLEATPVIGNVYCCAGVGVIDECKRNPEKTAQINVHGLLEVLLNMQKKGGKPVYFSGNMVFPGTKSDYTEEDTPKPITEYGKQKLLVEQAIQEQFKQFIIVRLTKVYGMTRGDKSLFTSWLDAWEGGGVVKSVTDITIAPVYVGDVIETVTELTSREESGIWHLPGTTSGTVFDFSEKLAHYFHIAPALLIPSVQSEFHWLERRPVFNTLGSTKMPLVNRKQFTVEQAFEQLRAQYPSFEQTFN